MAAKKKISTKIEDFFRDCMLLGITLESANIMAGWYFGTHLDHAWPWVIGPGLVAGRRLLGNKPSKAIATMALLVPTPGSDPDIDSYILKYRDRTEKEREYIFRGRGLPIQIPESKLSRFVKLAWRRQMNAIHGSQVQIMWDGNPQARMKRLTSNQVLSARYYLKVTEPRFTEAEYLACIRILVLSNCLDNRKQGRAGLLMYEPGRCMELILSYWLPSPRSNKLFSNFFRFSPTS